MRWRSLKSSAAFCGVCLLLLYLNNWFIGTESHGAYQVVNKPLKCPDVAVDPIKSNVSERLFEASCTADGGKLMTCLKDESDYYFPFSFLKKKFDISGKVGKDNVFEWYTSYSKVRVPEEKYDPLGPFGHFATYTVENRDRVRCISGESGVPMSTQWDAVPYYYPIQIAQYGLQHYSRMKTENSTGVTEVAIGTETKEWKGSPGDSDTSERVFFNDSEMGDVVNVSSSDSLSSPGCYVFLEDKKPHLRVISFKWKPGVNSSFTVLVRMKESNTLLLLNYVFETDDRCVWSRPGPAGGENNQHHFSFALGEMELGRWYEVTRDILVDAGRALSTLNGGGRKKDRENVALRHGDLRLVTLGFRGNATVVQHIRQKSEAHREFFFKTADWLVEQQNEKGGWSVPVERAIAERRLVLPAGWHSAMAQGHGLSVLTRAYAVSQEEKYLVAATNALNLFSMPASEGGVVNSFFGNVWYEEYPTTPGTFVLNGFMYSLVGLYDMKSLRIGENVNSTVADGPTTAEKLFEAGMKSLRSLLPLYDTGSGTIYDLRHVGLGTAPNLARWDYHAVHVYLLKWLAQITDDDFLDETAERWIGYSFGKRAKHN